MKLLSLFAIPLSILIGLAYFGIYDAGSLIHFDITLVGAIFLVAMQIFSYLATHQANKGTSFMGKAIKMVLAIPGILYIFSAFVTVNVGVDLEIIVALFLLTEGLYLLH